jgi:hypothetical protein
MPKGTGPKLTARQQNANFRYFFDGTTVRESPVQRKNIPWAHADLASVVVTARWPGSGGKSFFSSRQVNLAYASSTYGFIHL